MRDANKARPRDMTFLSLNCPDTTSGDGERTIPTRRTEIENSWCSGAVF
jgi:hypothetical protein